MPAAIELRDVTVRVGARTLVERISLSIGAGESVAVIGRSGAGKTTLLRLVNGLAAPTSGEVRIDGKALASIDLVAQRRRTGYIVQGIGLFPHRNVFDNVATVPRLLGWSGERTAEAVDDVLRLVHLEPNEFAHRFPRSLSGGERQRVGVARAIVFEPDILLCDEPFGALDAVVRRRQQELFLQSQSARRTTMLFVTHDLAEALFVADRVVMIDRGSIVADAPASSFTTLDHPAVRELVDAARLPEAIS